MEVGRIVPGEEMLVLSKPVMQFSFTYGVSRSVLYIYLYINHLYINHQFLNLLEIDHALRNIENKKKMIINLFMSYKLF